MLGFGAGHCGEHVKQQALFESCACERVAYDQAKTGIARGKTHVRRKGARCAAPAQERGSRKVHIKDCTRHPDVRQKRYGEARRTNGAEADAKSVGIEEVLQRDTIPGAALYA